MIGKKFSFSIFLFLPAFAFAQPSDSTNASSSGDEPLPFLNADFFADSLAEAYTLEEDPMGAQRLLQVRDSALTPSVNVSSSFNYTSNPFKQPKSSKTHNKSTSLDLSLSFNMGLGEYGIGDEVVCAPALSFIQMRSFMDPIEDYGSEFLKDPGLNTDTQIASLSLPFVLPNDFSLVFSQEKNKIITGKILDSLGIVKNANVINLKTNQGTFSNDNGIFRIFVSEGDTLSLSSIQHISKKVIITKNIIENRKMNIRIKYNIYSLDEFELKRHNLIGRLSIDTKNVPTNKRDSLLKNVMNFSPFVLFITFLSLDR